MPHTLEHLIKASGNAGAAGEHFSGHVIGAVSFASMQDYVVHGLSFTGALPMEDVGSAYNDGAQFSPTIGINEGSRAHLIRRTGNVLTALPTSSLGGFDVLLSSNITGANQGVGSSMTMTLRAPYGGAPAPSAARAWFSGYDYPSVPPHSDAESVTFDVQVTTPGGGISYVQWTLGYVVDNGPYNSQLLFPFSCYMNNRGRPSTDYEVAWFADENYTTPTSNGILSYPSTSVVKYFRWRQIGTSSWNDGGPLSWEDPRSDV